MRFDFMRRPKIKEVNTLLSIFLFLTKIQLTDTASSVGELEEYQVEVVYCDKGEGIMESQFNNSCIRVESCSDTVSYDAAGSNIKINCTFLGLFFCYDGDKLRGCTLVVNSGSQIPFNVECMKLFNELYRHNIPKHKLDCLNKLCHKYEGNWTWANQSHSLDGRCGKDDNYQKFVGVIIAFLIIVPALIIIIIICTFKKWKASRTRSSNNIREPNTLSLSEDEPSVKVSVETPLKERPGNNYPVESSDNM